MIMIIIIKGTNSSGPITRDIDIGFLSVCRSVSYCETQNAK